MALEKEEEEEEASNCAWLCCVTDQRKKCLCCHRGKGGQIVRSTGEILCIRRTDKLEELAHEAPPRHFYI